MNVIKKVSGIPVFALMLVMAVLSVGCSQESDYMPGPVYLGVLFTEGGDFGSETHEILKVDASAQTVVLEVKKSKLPESNLKYFLAAEWNNAKEEWTSAYVSEYGHFYGDYYDSYATLENGKPIIRVKIKENDSDSERKMLIYALFHHGEDHVFGQVEIIQAPTQ